MTLQTLAAGGVLAHDRYGPSIRDRTNDPDYGVRTSNA